jgi:NitT/TauT family transport system permease protein
MSSTPTPFASHAMEAGPPAHHVQRPSRLKLALQSNKTASLVLLVVLLAAWEGGTRLFDVPKFLIPPFSDVMVALWRGLSAGLLAKDGLWFHTAITLAEIVLGFFIGSAIGLALGVAISQMARVEAVLQPYVAAFQSLPKVAVAPIIVMWLGFGISSKVAIVCMLTFFPVLVTSIAGFKAIDTDRIDLMRSLSATPWQIFRKAKFPSALPYIFAGLDMAAAFAVVGAIVGEFVGAQAGLGVLILQMDAQMDTGGSFSVFIVLSVIGIALTSLLRVVQRRVLHWMPVEAHKRTVNA